MLVGRDPKPEKTGKPSSRNNYRQLKRADQWEQEWIERHKPIAWPAEKGEPHENA